MAFIYNDRLGTKRCKGCGKKKQGKQSPGLCDDCLRLKNATGKKKKK